MSLFPNIFIFVLLLTPFALAQNYIWIWNGTVADVTSPTSWICFRSPPSDPNCQTRPSPDRYLNSADQVRWSDCGYSNNMILFSGISISWPTVVTNTLACAGIIFDGNSDLTIYNAPLGLQDVTIIYNGGSLQPSTLRYTGGSNPTLQLSTLDCTQSSNGQFILRASSISIQSLLAASLQEIIFFTTDSTAFTLNVNIQSADVYPSSGSQYWTLDGVGSANFANLKLRGSNTLTIRPYPFSSSYRIRIGLFGVSTIQNGSLEIRDTLPQTGPSFLDVTASVNMSQGTSLTLWGSWQINGSVSGSGGSSLIYRPTSSAPITISGFLSGVNLNLYGDALLNGVFSDVSVSGSVSPLTLTRTVNNITLQMRSLNANGMVSFVGGQWEVVGSFVVNVVNLTDSILHFNLGSNGQLTLSNTQFVGNGEIQLLSGTFRLLNILNNLSASRVIVDGADTLVVIDGVTYTSPPLLIQNSGRVQNNGTMFLHSAISLNTNAEFINEGTLLVSKTTSVQMSGNSTFQNNRWFNVSQNTTIGTLGANNSTFLNRNKMVISASFITDNFTQRNGGSTQLDLSSEGMLVATSISNDPSCVMNLEGFVQVNQTFFNNGEVHIAGQNKTGLWTLEGDFWQYSQSLLSFEVNSFGNSSSGGDFDRFLVNGDVALNGSVRLTPLNSDALTNVVNGSWYILINATQLYGKFENVSHNFGNNIQVKFCYTNTNAILIVYNDRTTGSVPQLPSSCIESAPPTPPIPSPYTPPTTTTTPSGSTSSTSNTPSTTSNPSSSPTPSTPVIRSVGFEKRPFSVPLLIIFSVFFIFIFFTL